jgi:diguanylate cyclase (GGDEF)-like protein
MTRKKRLMSLRAVSNSASAIRLAADHRHDAIRAYDVLDTPPEQSFDDIARLAASIFGSKSAAISFLDGQRQWFKSQVGLGVRETPISESFCAHAVRQDEVMVVGNAAGDRRFATNPLVTGEPHIRFYAGMPIRAFDGTPIAALCVIDPEPRPEGITDLQRTALEVLAAQVEAQLELRRALNRREEQAEVQCALSNAMRYMAEHDTLTGLPNRAVFQQRLADAVDRVTSDATRTAVMLIDVDHFKQVNDAYGHDAGDALLREFGARLRRALRATDIVARLGGDEFAAILNGISADETLDKVCQSLDERLREPLIHKGRLIECRASIGIALYPDHAHSPEALVKCADLALNAAKFRRGSIVLFKKQMGARFDQELALLGEARAALAADRIVPGYQPKIDLRTGTIAGFEALARLRSAAGLREHRDMFSVAFKHSEVAAQIGGRMIKRILDDVKSWRDAGLDFGRVAINSCAADFAPNDFAERLLASLAARGLDPRLIELEVTEGIFLGRGSHHVARALKLLSSHGVRVALDDFGTGYASLSNLKQFPVDVLKIDRAFVKGVATDADDTAIVRALIGLGKNLGIETVAEGVETAEQAALVGSWGCCTAQGHLYGAASSAEHVRVMLGPVARVEAA